MARLVLVDAEALEACRAMLDDDRTLAGLYQVPVEALAPVVPELPEGCSTVSEDERGIVVLWHDGNEYWAGNGEIGTCDYDRYGIPNDAATYLLARWQSLQGGA